MTSVVNKPRILVVEDEAIVARDIQQQLEELGYEAVGHTTRGEDAITLAGDLRPDLVLMDVRLAGAIDGIDAAQAIRTRFALPVVFLTASAEEATLQRAASSEPFGYILKPFSVREVRAVLEMALQKHRAEQKLRESESRYRMLFENASDGIFYFSVADATIAFVNESFARMHGYSIEEMQGMNLRDLDAPESARLIPERIAQMVAGRHLIFEVEHFHKDGHRVPLEVSASVVSLGGERLVLAFHRDITERKLAEETIARTSALLQRTGAIAKVGGWELDLPTQKLFWSLETFRIHELDPAVTPTVELAIDYYAPEARPVIRAAVQAAIDGGTPFDLELPMITAAGRPIWVRAQGSVVMENGRAVRLLGAFQDITKRRDADATLRLESAALAVAANAIVITNSEGVIEWANAAFTTFTGYSTAEAIGCKPGALLKSGKHDQRFYQNLWDTILGGSVWRGEMINRRKNGTLYTEEMTITPLKDDRDRITHFIAVKQDITERKRLEEQFRQAQKMESVGRLAGGVAHDFNNMLGVILGNIELALRQVNPTEPLHADLVEVQDAAKRSAALTRQLLAFARKEPTVPRALHVNKSVAATLKILRRLIGKEIPITWQPGSGVWVITMDPSQLDQILTNLCLNARDAIGGAGTITIATANRAIDTAYAADRDVSPGDYVRLTVRDDGCGMDEEMLTHIFEPFFTTKATGEGTGLGLATVYGVVKQNHGFITVSSEAGKGTAFEIHLPRHVPDVAPAKTAPGVAAGTAPTPRAGETVLLVEDEPSILKLAARVLRGEGYTVLEAASPDEAIRLAGEHGDEIHLLLTDVIMPGMNGHDLANTLLSTRPQLKRMYMSGYSAGVMAHSGLLHEGAAFIQKPFLINDLQVKVRQTLDADLAL